MEFRSRAKDLQSAISLLTQFGCVNAVAWQRDRLALGDTLLAKYAMGMMDGRPTNYPQWWSDLIGFKPLVRQGTLTRHPGPGEGCGT